MSRGESQAGGEEHSPHTRCGLQSAGFAAELALNAEHPLSRSDTAVTQTKPQRAGGNVQFGAKAVPESSAVSFIGRHPWNPSARSVNFHFCFRQEKRNKGCKCLILPTGFTALLALTFDP